MYQRICLSVRFAPGQKAREGEHAGAYYGRAYARYYLKNYEDAISDYDEVIVRKPDFKQDLQD